MGMHISEQSHGHFRGEEIDARQPRAIGHLHDRGIDPRRGKDVLRPRHALVMASYRYRIRQTHVFEQRVGVHVLAPLVHHAHNLAHGR